MADANRVNVRERSQKLIHIQLDLQHRHGLLEFYIVARSTIYCFGHVFKNEVKIDLVILLKRQY